MSMRVLILTNNFLPGNKEATKITLTEFEQKLQAKGHIVNIIAEKSIVGTLKKVRSLRKENKTSFDIIHGFSAAPLLVIKTVLVKIIWYRKAQTIQTLKSYSKNILGSLYFSSILNAVNKITVSTFAFKQKLVSQGCLKQKIEIIPSPVNSMRFKSLNKEEMKHKYCFQNKTVLFYYGSFYRTKGVPELIKASKSILLEDPTRILLICPRHAVDKDIAELVLKLGLQNQVIFETRAVNIVEYLNMAEVLILPYTSLVGTEGNPSCLLEAASCKIPIVTSDFEELREIVEPEKEVLMGPPGDIVKLEAQIRRILADNQLRKKLIKNAFQKSKQFDSEIIAQKFIRLYQELVK